MSRLMIKVLKSERNGDAVTRERKKLGDFVVKGMRYMRCLAHVHETWGASIIDMHSDGAAVKLAIK